MKFHALRHSAATLLRARGVDLKLVQAILGHASYAMTSELNADIYIEELRAGADTLDALLAPGRRAF